MNVSLTREQIRRIDHLATERYGIAGLVLMENAGGNAARIIIREFGTSGAMLVCCGPGNNGGDGCVIARHLHNSGWEVRLAMIGDPTRMTSDTAVNFRIIEAMGLQTVVGAHREATKRVVQSIREEDLVVDALLGTGFQGEVRSPTAEAIEAINTARSRAVAAVDVPSGLDCDTGQPSNATIRADLTITFVSRKAGFDAAAALPYVGRVEVADIGAPRELIAEVVSGKA